MRPAYRRRAVRHPYVDAELEILLFFIENQKTSSRIASRILGYGKTLILKTLKKYGMKPFRAHVVQGLRDGDHMRRLDFIDNMDQLIHENEINFLSTVLWTDESKFTNNGLFNRYL